MQIDLPEEVVERANKLAADGEDAAAVLTKALERMEFEAQEVAAVMEGVKAYQEGRHRPFEEFDREIREEFGFRPAE